MDTIKFSELNIGTETLDDLSFHGFSDMMPIQSQAIPILLAGEDIIGQAKTGTGKTLAFAIPIVEKITPEKHVQALIITPTRELAMQVSKEIKKIGFKKKVGVACVYGGRSIEIQADQVRKGAQVVVGTPGRMLDLMRRGLLDLTHTRMLVLDEADRMLDMGFIDDIKKIISKVPKERQTMLFSATIDDNVKKFASQMTKQPKMISIGEEKIMVDTITQCYYEIHPNDKLDVFEAVVKAENPTQAIIFCNTKRWVETLSKLLQRRGLESMAIHGDLTQSQREKVMEGFKSNKFKFLIATDVAARGLDIDGVTHVFNYDIPQDPESYIHRVGRTARAGRTGKAISFISPNEIRGIWDIQNRCEMQIPLAKLAGY